MFELADSIPQSAVIKVIGVGGGGGNAVQHMVNSEVDGVEFICANTDAQALDNMHSRTVIQIGGELTKGLGAGANPDVGRHAAIEDRERIAEMLEGADMVFITAGMGGGTGTGAAPIIAQAARELGVLTVGVVTKPFQFEGSKRMRQAEEGLEALQKVVDTLIIIPNQNLFRLANEKTTFTEAFALADDVLYQGVKGVTDLMVRPGLINLDFADVRAVMDEMGKAMMGTGEADGDDRAVQAAEKAIANPLLDEISLAGAKGVLINITGGYDLTLFELDEAANRIREEVDPEANIIVGSTLDPDMAGSMRVSVVATGIDAVVATGDIPVPRRSMAEPLKPAAEAVEAATHHTEDLAPQHAYEPAPQPQTQHAAASLSVTSAQPAQRTAPQPAPQAHQAAPQPAPQARQPAPQPQQAHDRTLFDAPAARAPAPQQAADDLPPPAYSAPREPQPDLYVEDEAQGYVAPRPRQPGTPSPEALRRLEAAVGKAPMSQRPMAATRPAHPQDAPHPQADKPRFGINSLINRMTGHSGEGHAAQPQAAPRAQAPAQPRAQAPAQPRAEVYDDEQTDEQDRVEIPAFLRRQAN
jgi:cell division protein FtsZ